MSVTSTTEARLLTGVDEISDGTVHLAWIHWAASQAFSVGFKARLDHRDPAMTVAGANLLINASSFPWENDDVKGQEMGAVETDAIGMSLKNSILNTSLRVPSDRRAQAESDMAEGNKWMALLQTQCSFYKQLILGWAVSLPLRRCWKTLKEGRFWMG